MTKDNGYLLPSVVNPPRISFCISIPNETNHLLAFWGALDELGKWWNWQKDGTHTAKDVADVWADVWQVNHEAFINRDEEGCSEMTDPCCPETNDKLQQIIDLLRGGATITFNAVSQPPDFRIDCTPDNFNGNDDDTPTQAIQWVNALCLALVRFAVACLYDNATKQNFIGYQPQILALGSLSAPPDFTTQLGDSTHPESSAAVRQILESDNGFNDAICMMRDALIGKINTFASFKTALLDLFNSVIGNPDPAIPNTVSEVLYYGQNRINYAVFSRALENAHDDIVGGFAFTCPCDSTPCDAATFNIIPVNDCTVERIDDTHWHITQLHSTHVDPDKRQFVAIIRDASYRCINITGFTQGQSGYNIYDCDGVNHTGVGGSGGVVIQNGWTNIEYESDPIVGIDTIATIICP